MTYKINLKELNENARYYYVKMNDLKENQEEPGRILEHFLNSNNSAIHKSSNKC